tara:strand:- start:7061 stop:7585 length:525 start_codon:yes stop_codon:yes gene_type:complete
MMSLLRSLWDRWQAGRDPLAYARRLGVRVGDGCRLVSVSKMTFGSEPYLVALGDHVEVAAEVSFLTHDGGAWIFRDQLPDLDIFGNIVVGNNVFIGRRVILLPGSRIGNNCVIGAGAVVKGTLIEGGVYAGVPARRLGAIDSYKDKLVQESLNTKRLSRTDKRELLERHFLKDE